MANYQIQVRITWQTISSSQQGLCVMIQKIILHAIMVGLTLCEISKLSFLQICLTMMIFTDYIVTKHIFHDESVNYFNQKSLVSIQLQEMSFICQANKVHSHCISITLLKEFEDNKTILTILRSHHFLNRRLWSKTTHQLVLL